MITLSGQEHPGADYQWYRNGVAIPLATERALHLEGGPSVDGSYVLRVTTVEGCALTDPVVIQRPIITNHFADTIELCNDLETARISARRFTGATYRWDDGSTQAYRNVSEPGAYSVTVTENCVEHVEEVVVRENIPFTYFLRTTPAQPCEGDTVTIHFSTSASNTRIYFRSLESGKDLTPDHGKLQIVAGEEDAILAFISTDCGTQTDTIHVPVSEPFHISDVTIQDIYCNEGDGRIDLSVDRPGQVMYEWRNAAGELVGNDEAFLEVAVAGDYQVTLIDGVRCPTTMTYTVLNQSSFTADIAVEQAKCDSGGSISIDAITGKYPYTVKWFKNGSPDYEEGNPSTRKNLPAGEYAVLITDASGCSIEQNISLKGSIPVTASVTSGYENCADGTSGFISMSGDGGSLPYAYFLSAGKGQAKTDFTGLTSGTYKAWIEDGNGCSSTPISVTLNELSLPEIDLGPDRFIDLGDSVILDAGALDISPGAGSISWSSPESLSCSDCTAPAASPFTTTAYTVAYVSPDLCMVTDSVMVHVDRNPRIYIPNAFSPNGDDHNDVFRVYIPNGMATLTDLMIFDRWGELIWNKDDQQDQAWDGTYRGKPLSVGVYVYVAKVRLPDNTILPLEGSVTLVK